MAETFLRNVIGEYVSNLGKTNEHVVIVNADLMGTCRNKSFVEKFPKRSFNVGIAEQNMVSFAAGLAHEGFIPYVFTMAPFMSMRACEQVRTDVAYGDLDVRFVSTYSGVSGGISGATHWALEDCAIMCGIPSMTVIELSDPTQAKKMLDLSLEYKGPIYIRSGVEPVAEIYDENYSPEIGKASKVCNGSDGAVICSGNIVGYALEAAKKLKEKYGVKISVFDMHTIKPIDNDAVISAAKTGAVIVAQDHNIVGGLGYMVAAVIAESGIAVKFKILGIPDKFFAMAHAPYLYRKYSLDAEGLELEMIKMIGLNGGVA